MSLQVAHDRTGKNVDQYLIDRRQSREGTLPGGEPIIGGVSWS